MVNALQNSIVALIGNTGLTIS